MCSAPSGNVVVKVTPSNPFIIVNDRVFIELQFSPTNWNQPQVLRINTTNYKINETNFIVHHLIRHTWATNDTVFDKGINI